eukprot:GFYU01016669.1.p1 GENE.GFYU01016669.1~~GFYU01016669.1.p1  ORF type:complete len:327 (-),score=93.57 GFYU01016669.1:111-1091(-)
MATASTTNIDGMLSIIADTYTQLHESQSKIEDQLSLFATTLEDIETHVDDLEENENELLTQQRQLLTLRTQFREDAIRNQLAQIRDELDLAKAEVAATATSATDVSKDVNDSVNTTVCLEDSTTEAGEVKGPKNEEWEKLVRECEQLRTQHEEDTVRLRESVEKLESVEKELAQKTSDVTALQTQCSTPSNMERRMQKSLTLIYATALPPHVDFCHEKLDEATQAIVLKVETMRTMIKDLEDEVSDWKAKGKKWQSSRKNSGDKHKKDKKGDKEGKSMGDGGSEMTSVQQQHASQSSTSSFQRDLKLISFATITSLLVSAVIARVW